MENCKHDKVDWEPIETEYGSDGTAGVWQPGKCMECSADLLLTYTQESVTDY